MKFELQVTGYFYSYDKAEKLKKYGFKFEKIDSSFGPLGITRDKVSINIETLRDLEGLEKSTGSQLIISFAMKTIEIYNGYRE